MSDVSPAADAASTARETDGGEGLVPPSAPTALSPEPVGATTTRRDLTALPNYSRSLLKIRVPVSVQLAGKKEVVQEVISLAPGSIIKFEKGCEELLQMIVGGRTIAEGEAVKIGDKFGFRVTSMVMPREHFVTVKRESRQGAGGRGQ